MHRLIDRLGLRRQQLFAAQSNVVERLRALARFGELASGFARRSPHATPREFARHIAAVADFGLREHEEPDLLGPSVVQVVALDGAAALEAEHVYVLGLHAGLTEPVPEPIPRALKEAVAASTEVRGPAPVVRQALYVAVTRTRRRVVLAYPAVAERGAAFVPVAGGGGDADGAGRGLGGPGGGDVRAGRDPPLDLSAAAR